MKIFLSYSRPDRDIAERLALSLRGDDHTVFLDQSEIEAGDEFDARIREAIEDCDLFIFLVSPDSIAAGSYAMAELRIVEDRWKHPRGHVLPVMVRHVNVGLVPPYLRAVSILKPRGDVVAESSAAVARQARTRPRTVFYVAAAIAIVLAVSAWGLYSRAQSQRAAQAVRAEIEQTVTRANRDIEVGEYAAAIKVLGDARARFPDDFTIRQAHERTAMSWLRNIRVRVGEQTFSDIVAQLRPILADGVAVASGQHAGDLHAHLGWCEFLKSRDGQSNADPVVHYARAVEADAANPYANAMWGHWILWRGRNLTEAGQRFETAASSGRESEWVRNFQLTALLGRQAFEFEVEAVRTANHMRTQGVRVTDPNRLWSVYDSAVLRQNELQKFLQVIPARDHVQTFDWLFPASSVQEGREQVHRLIRVRLQEAAGDAAEALAAYKSLQSELRRQNSQGPLMDRVTEGIKRLEP